MTYTAQQIITNIVRLDPNPSTCTSYYTWTL